MDSTIVLLLWPGHSFEPSTMRNHVEREVLNLQWGMSTHIPSKIPTGRHQARLPAEEKQTAAKLMSTLPVVGAYHTPFLGYLVILR